MDAIDDAEEEQLTDYAVQLSIQESLEANRCASTLCEERFLVTSEVNQKIIAAIKQGEVSELQQLAKFSYAFDEASDKGWFPLHEAIVQPLHQVLEIVLDASYKTVWEQKTLDGETPLTLAVNAGFAENVRVLLEKKIWPNTKNNKGETPLLIAVRKSLYTVVSLLIKHDAYINQPCVKRWSVMHEAAKQGRSDIVALLLKSDGNVNQKDGYGVTPLGVAAEYGHSDVLEHLIHKGGDVHVTADDGATVLFEAAGGGNPDCVAVLLEYGASANMPDKAGHLPIHRAAFQGHYLALKYLIPVTLKSAIKRSGISPVHSAADGQSTQCLELLTESGFDVNDILGQHVSDSYHDERKTALFFAVSHDDIMSTELLLRAGADPNKDPLTSLLVAVRSGNHEIVRLLLAHRANVNCYFKRVNDTHFPSAIQYALSDEVMLRLLLNNGYNAEMCFECMHGDTLGNSFAWSTLEEEILPGWTSCIVKDTPFCDFITVSWMTHLVGRVIRVLLDYVDFVPVCSKLMPVLEKQMEWQEIYKIIEPTRKALINRTGCPTTDGNDQEGTGKYLLNSA
ncbi:ankyrin repeat and SOCS box protein 15 isoform X2 [Latimeria chalumnae]|uniref:ankyrin repeat and SOCS box protein 15 isoform X2 n=1 Tax=Latimeria chalumnae TaxID=7897 RepID=UPI0003C1A9CC